MLGKGCQGGFAIFIIPMIFARFPKIARSKCHGAGLWHTLNKIWNTEAGVQSNAQRIIDPGRH
jgi:hypothetical protein